MFTDRNVFNLIYKKKLLSYYVYEQVSSSKKTLRICDFFIWKIAWFPTNKSGYEGNRSELWLSIADIETYWPREWGLFTTVYLRHGPTVDLIKRFHSFTDTSIDDVSPIMQPYWVAIGMIRIE